MFCIYYMERVCNNDDIIVRNAPTTYTYYILRIAGNLQGRKRWEIFRLKKLQSAYFLCKFYPKTTEKTCPCSY